jgi:glycosyltransferase involved in cell wall biosynthesis
MRVAFDTTTAAFEHKTGTGVYCEELVRAYQEKFAEDKVVHSYRFKRWLNGQKYLLPLSKNSRREILLDPWTFFSGYRHEIFHGLNSRLPMLVGCKKIATVHDLFSIYGEFSDERFREDQSKKLKLMISRADHIIVPATFTKNQLMSKMGLASEKITVVGEGVRSIYLEDVTREESLPALKSKFGLQNPYLLFVGTLEKRKNIIGLIKAYGRLHSQISNTPDLVLVGGEGYGFEEIKASIESSGLQNKIKRLGFVNEDMLADLYRSCEAFVFLSHEEGFGIPVIEAMACGAPVLTSNTTSLPEVGGGHTWLVDPHDFEKAAALLVEVLKKNDMVLGKSRKGTAYARALTWSKVAEETRLVYAKTLA